MWNDFIGLAKQNRNCMYHTLLIKATNLKESKPNKTPLDKGAYLKINFLISQPNHMLWVLKKNRLDETENVLLSIQNIILC